MFSPAVVLSVEDLENPRSWISVAPRSRRHSQDSHKCQAPDHLSKRNFRDGMMVSDLNPYDGGSRSVHLDQVVPFSYRDSLVRQFSPQTINSTLVSGSSTTLLVEISSPQDTGASQIPQPPPGYSIKPAKSRNSGFTAATKKQKKIKQQQMKAKAKQLKGELLVRQDFLSVPETGVPTSFLSNDVAPKLISLSSQNSPSSSSSI